MWAFPFLCSPPQPSPPLAASSSLAAINLPAKPPPDDGLYTFIQGELGRSQSCNRERVERKRVGGLVNLLLLTTLGTGLARTGTNTGTPPRRSGARLPASHPPTTPFKQAHPLAWARTTPYGLRAFSCAPWWVMIKGRGFCPPQPEKKTAGAPNSRRSFGGGEPEVPIFHCRERTPVCSAWEQRMRTARAA